MQQTSQDGYEDIRQCERERGLDPNQDVVLVGSPTLAQINSSGYPVKRIKRESYSSYHSHLPSPDLTSSLSDDHPSPVMTNLSKVFDQRGGGGDHLSASFKSLYKSIFGHSVCSGEYLNPPPLPPSTATELSSSDSSFPLGAPAVSLQNNVNPAIASNYSPHFYTLMDSFRDIAETNSWDKLDPSQVQGLMESFRAAERDQFGLDAESYSRVTASFEQFFQELNCRFVTGNGGCHINELSSVAGIGGNAAQPLNDALLPHYTEQPDTMPMFPISNASPPSSNYPPPQRTPPDHMTPQAGHMISEPSHTFSTQFPRPNPSGASRMVTQRLPDIPGKTATNMDLHAFDNDDEDDFDWSKLM